LLAQVNTPKSLPSHNRDYFSKENAKDKIKKTNLSFVGTNGDWSLYFSLIESRTLFFFSLVLAPPKPRRKQVRHFCSDCISTQHSFAQQRRATLH
jgi:hypothetical protein